MTKIDHEHIVIGVGGIGSAALYHLAQRDADVLGIDQYPAGHDNGSSHGDSRLIRLVYFEHPDYVPLIHSAFTLWRELEQASGDALLRMTGLLQAGPQDGEVINGLLRAARTHDLSMERLDAATANDRFPGISLKPEQTAIFDQNAGILQVEECVKTHVRLAQNKGAQLKSGFVTSWEQQKNRIAISVGNETLYCKKLIITPGAWAPALLPAIKPFLEIRRKSLFWFNEHKPEYLVQNQFPVFFIEDEGHNYYGFPAINEKGVKVADHQGGRPLSGPKALDKSLDESELEDIRNAITQYLPGVTHRLSHHTNCMYTMSRDEHFIVGQHPDNTNVHFVAGLSGHGFKFATVLGQIMADLSITGATNHPVSFLSPKRFQR
ncbi:MAG: sarcosine oxidase [Candidatus Azotimanducaceae bacterium]|jgi:sarcosine oxidase